jgi:hypothetical protein
MITTHAWGKGGLFAAMLLVGSGYIFAYVFFVSHSENFIVSRHNRAAIKYGEAHPASAPTTWLFGEGRADNSYLGSGWFNRGTSSGVWMFTQDAWIAFAAEKADTDWLLTLNTIVVTTQITPLNRIEVYVNGQILGSWERGGASARNPIVVWVPSALVRDGKWYVRIHADHLASLARPGSDIRTNGQNVLLTSMVLDQAGRVKVSAKRLTISGSSRL